MIDEDGECKLWSTNKRDWVIAWRVMGGGAGKIREATEKTYLTEPQVRTIYIYQHEGTPEDVAEIEDISRKAAYSRTDRVRTKRDRSENTRRAFSETFSFIDVPEAHSGTGQNLPNRKEHDWRSYCNELGMDADYVERVKEKTWLSPMKAFAMRGFQKGITAEDMAEVTGTTAPPSISSLSDPKAFEKRYIPKVENCWRRSENTMKFLNIDYDFVEEDWAYSYR